MNIYKVCARDMISKNLLHRARVPWCSEGATVRERVVAKILLAEDDSSMRLFLAGALQRAGHDVQSCVDGLSALAVLEEHSGFDLLLADIVMPGMDGIELSQKAVALRPELKVMFITGFAAVAMGQKNGVAPSAPVLSKPFHLKDLVDRVDTILAA